MREGIIFSYDGLSSQEMELLNVSISGGMFEETFVAERDIHETKIRGREKPYLHGVTRLPLSFKLAFAFTDYYNEEKIRKVARWLDQEYYKPFFTEDNPSRIFYCMLNSSSSLFHNGLKQGYVELEMRCDSPYSYSPEYVSQIYDFGDSAKVSNVLETTKEDFLNGEIHGLTVTDTGELTLKRAKWGDLSTKKWGDL